MRMICLAIALLVLAALCACNAGQPEIEGAIKRYNELVSQGYRSLNMNPLQEITTKEQATKLYYHMAALGEGRLRMESTLKRVEFRSIEVKGDQATAETRETWDFAHVEIESGKKIYEERDFIYVMGYLLKKQDGRWLVLETNTVSGQSTNNVIPWPEVKGKRPAAAGR